MNETTIELLAGRLAAFLAAFFERVTATPIIGQLTLADLLAAAILFGLVLLAFLIVAGWLRRFQKRHEQRETVESWPNQLVFALSRPLYAIIWLFGLQLVLAPVIIRAQDPAAAPATRAVLEKIVDVGVFAIGIWLFYRLTDVLRIRFTVWARKSKSQLDDLLIPAAIKSLRVLLPLIAIFLCLPILDLPSDYDDVVSKVGSLTLIGVVAWIIFQAIRLGEDFVLLKYDVKAADNLEARKVHTQVKVLSKTAYFVTTLFAIASMLMVFEEARRFGTNILASAGVVGVIMGFAAQRTISNLFAGFQIAMTQPIRIDDVVIVEGEWGRIEEITLTYVVIRIWDQRRLIVPLSHFIEKPFQNWTRVSAEILGSVFVWADYTVRLDEIRNALKGIIEEHPDWDKKFWNLQVTDVNERAMQIRVLATSSDSGKNWNLRCHIREKLIEFLQKHHRDSLPRIRTEFQNGIPLDLKSDRGAEPQVEPQPRERPQEPLG